VRPKFICDGLKIFAFYSVGANCETLKQGRYRFQQPKDFLYRLPVLPSRQIFLRLLEGLQNNNLRQVARRRRGTSTAIDVCSRSAFPIKL
jgi:hypothetical protein